MIEDGRPQNATFLEYQVPSMLDVPIDLLGREVYQRRNDRQPLVVVDRATAPVKEVVRTGADVDVTAFPAPHHHAMDPGPYVTATASMSSRPTDPLRSASSNTGTIASTCAREASSGTTPP